MIEKHDAAVIDTQSSRRQLALLGSPDETHTFQTFDDAGSKNPTLARTLHGTLDALLPELSALSSKGSGVFVSLNELPPGPRRNDRVTRVRALFADLDGTSLDYARRELLNRGLAPHAIIETSSGRWHLYFKVEPGFPLPAFKAAQKRLAEICGGDPCVNDLARVVRLAGTFNRKSATPFRVRFHDA